jgi:hypothetical protein
MENILKPISNSNFMIKFLLVVLCSIINTLAINNYAFDNQGKLVCDNYVLNTYLYVVLAFVIMGAVFIIDERFKFMFKLMGMGMMYFGVLTLIAIGLIIALNYVDPTNLVASHVIWTTLITVIGFTLTTSIYFGVYTGVLYQAILLTIVVTISTGLIGYYYGEQLISVDFEKYLSAALILLIVSYLIGPFFVKDIEYFLYIMAGISLVIFILLLLAYNKNIRKRAETCTTPNYPLESFGLIIKIVNVLKNIITLLGRGKGGRRR